MVDGGVEPVLHLSRLAGEAVNVVTDESVELPLGVSGDEGVAPGADLAGVGGADRAVDELADQGPPAPLDDLSAQVPLPVDGQPPAGRVERYSQVERRPARRRRGFSGTAARVVDIPTLVEFRFNV